MRFLIFIFVLYAIFLGCDGNYLDEEGILEGVVFFSNEKKNIAKDTAKGAIVELTISGELNRRLIAEDGTYRFEFLEEGSYETEFRFEKNDIKYLAEEIVIIEDDIVISNPVLEPIDGNFSINGKVSFVNLLTSSFIVQPAKGALVRLYKGNSEFGALIGDFMIEDSTYNFSFLESGDYFLQASLEQLMGTNSALRHLFEKQINLTNDMNQDLVLEWDELTTLLKIKVIDSNGQIIPNAEVCLFTSEIILNLNSPGCMGSTTLDATNNSGIVIFSNLENIKYFVHSNFAISDSTSLNGTTELTIERNSLNEVDISIQ